MTPASSSPLLEKLDQKIAALDAQVLTIQSERQKLQNARTVLLSLSGEEEAEPPVTVPVALQEPVEQESVEQESQEVAAQPSELASTPEAAPLNLPVKEAKRGGRPRRSERTPKSVPASNGTVNAVKAVRSKRKELSEEELDAAVARAIQQSAEPVGAVDIYTEIYGEPPASGRQDTQPILTILSRRGEGRWERVTAFKETPALYQAIS